MSEKAPQSNPFREAIDTVDAIKQKEQEDTYIKKLQDETGVWDSSVSAEDAKQRLGELADYDDLLRKMQDRPNVNWDSPNFNADLNELSSPAYEEELEAEKARKEAEYVERRAKDDALNAALDAKFAADPKLRFMLKISDTIHELRTPESADDDRRLDELENRLQELLVRYSEQPDYDPAIADMLMDHGDGAAVDRAAVNALGSEKQQVGQSDEAHKSAEMTATDAGDAKSQTDAPAAEAPHIDAEPTAAPKPQEVVADDEDTETKSVSSDESSPADQPDTDKKLPSREEIGNAFNNAATEAEKARSTRLPSREEIYHRMGVALPQQEQPIMATKGKLPSREEINNALGNNNANRVESDINANHRIVQNAVNWQPTAPAKKKGIFGRVKQLFIGRKEVPSVPTAEQQVNADIAANYAVQGNLAVADKFKDNKWEAPVKKQRLTRSRAAVRKAADATGGFFGWRGSVKGIDRHVEASRKSADVTPIRPEQPEQESSDERRAA